MDTLIHSFPLRGGLKKNFFRKTLKGGGRGLPEPEISLSEKTEIIFGFLLFKRGGGSYPFQKGVIIKNWGFWILLPKGGVSSNP